MLQRGRLLALGGATARTAEVGACLVLTQAGRHLTCVLAGDAAEAAGGVALLDARIVRFVDNGWAMQDAAALHIIRDEAHWGICDAGRSRWVPHHSALPYRLVELAQAEHRRLLGHLDHGRPWDVFKYVQLTYLAEEGFTGGRDRLAPPPGYGDVARTDRWYAMPPVRG